MVMGPLLGLSTLSMLQVFGIAACRADWLVECSGMACTMLGGITWWFRATQTLVLSCRKGYYDDTDIAHTLIPQMRDWGAAACTLHGRSRQQRYSRAADWEYIE